mgnify:FL=1
MTALPIRLNNLRCLVAASSLTVLPVLADSGHQHETAAAGETGQDRTPWQLDVVMGYQKTATPLIAGFLPYDGHYRSAGFGLQHLDIGRSFRLPDQGVYGQVVVSRHSSSTDIHEAWIGHRSGAWQLQAGQQLVDLGWLNRLHSHDRLFVDLPLMYQAMWGGEWSEAEVRLGYQRLDLDSNSGLWQWHSALSLLGTSQMNTARDGVAAMVTTAVSARYGQWQHAIKLDVYGAEVGRRGMQLFSTSTATHSHGSTATEYFDGGIGHIAMGLSSEWDNTWGRWRLQGEYQQRQEKGDLSSAAGQTTDASAVLDLRSWGSYLDLSWQQSRLAAGVRWQTLGSDVGLSRVSGDDLADSILNHQSRSPSYLNMLIAWRLPWQGSKLRLQYNVPLTDALALPRIQLQWLYSVAF